MSLKITARVWGYSRQRNSGLVLLLALADFAHDSGVCWAHGLTLETIARKARVNERQGRNLLAQLAASGELFAPPATGRGQTTRYFVATGLDAAAIAATLEREFGYDALDAERIAGDLLRQQQGESGNASTETSAANPSPASEAIAPARTARAAHPSPTTERGQSPAPFSGVKGGNLAQKGGNLAPERGQPSAERGQSSVEKAAIQRRPLASARAAGRPKVPVAPADPIMIRSDPSCDPSSSAQARSARMEVVVTPTEGYLLDQGFYPATAHQHAALPLDAVRRYVERRKGQGWNRNAIAQGLGREHGQLSGTIPAPPSQPLPDWLEQARALCPPDSVDGDVAWVAALLSEGSPPREARELLAFRIANRATSTGATHAAA